MEHYRQSAGDSPNKESIKEMIARKRRAAASSADETAVFDPYSNATSSMSEKRKGTGLIYDDDVMMKHKCEWDENYPENEKRLGCILKRIKELKLPERCVKIPEDRVNTHTKVLSKHKNRLFEELERISNLNLEEMEEEASKYDAVYFCKETFEAACKSVDFAVNLVTAVAKKLVTNGMAIIRPPGHHAMENEFCGYCYFNNVAIAAEHCIQEKLAKKILIVDYDVHHGQGTQQMFYDRNDVLYFSIHRYEQGTFWPNLLESNFNFIGKGKGLGYNVNVPLNQTGLVDSDYLAIIFHVLLPIAYEFSPDLVIVSAGYDAAIGCPEGEMRITPSFYSHLITLLSGLAKGKLAVCLEGGYFLPSLQEGAALTLKALLGDPCPPLEPTRNIHPSVIETIVNVRSVLKDFWKCFEVAQVSENASYKIQYYGEPCKPPFLTRDCYPLNDSSDRDYFAAQIESLKSKYPKIATNSVGFVYDPVVLLHKPRQDNIVKPERPERLSAILNTITEYGIKDRCRFIPCTPHDLAEYNLHDDNYTKLIEDLKIDDSNDIYMNDNTFRAIQTSVSNVMSLIDDVFANKSKCGVALIRPPGHHAEFDQAMGFCFLNNAAIGANYLVKKYESKRVLILDFDVHHGNGTQNFFYNRKDVMYISVHRYDDGKFFPTSKTANFDFDGFGLGKGYNVNIPFNKDKMGDSEYLSVFHNLILPIAYSYAPDFILVSAGFDAGINDPLGGYQISPELFGHFITFLKPLAAGRLCLILEGGYNLNTLSTGMGVCFKALLGEEIPIPQLKPISKEACNTIRNVSAHFVKYWPVLQINTEELATIPILNKPLKIFTPQNHTENLCKILDEKSAQNSEFIEQQIKLLDIPQ